MARIEYELPDYVEDIGHDHFIAYYGWAPDRELNPQYDGIEDEERSGLTVYHRAEGGGWCGGGVTFDTPAMRAVEHPRRWTVESFEPLTLSPSILCSCGDHGYIRDGRWVPA